MRLKLKYPKVKRWLCVLLITGLGLGLLGGILVLGINLWVTGSVRKNILTEQQAAQLKDVDCIIVLGCQVKSDGTPSHMLEDRLRRSVALY